MVVNFSRAQQLAIVAIILLAIAVYAQLIPVGALNWDDDSNVFKNPFYKAGIWKAFWVDSYFGLYVPVTSMVWQALYYIGGGKALPFRILNLALHLANIYLVFLLLKSLAERWHLKSGWGLIAALSWFALHPMQIQAVAWISGGRDLLSAFFSLLCVYTFFRWKHWSALIPSTIFFALAVLSKPNSVVLPALVPFLCFMVSRERLKMSFAAAVLWTGVSGVSIYMTLYAQRDFLLPLKWWERLVIMGDTYSFYLQKLIFPFPLSANYDRQPEIILTSWEPFLRAGALAAVLGFFYRWAKTKEPRFFLALGWFALLLPVSGLVAFGYQRISTPADHYNYLPMVALAGVLMLWLNVCPYWPRWAAPISTALIGVLAVLSLMRVQVWTSDSAFFDDMISYAPDSYSTGLGMSLVKCEQQQQYIEGERWCHMALAKRPNDIMVLANLAYCRFNSRDYKKTIELESYLEKLDMEEMLTKQPSAYSSFLASLGSALVEDKHYYDGYQMLCEAFRIKPSEKNHETNIVVANGILQKNGIDPVCEPKFQPKKKPLASEDDPEPSN